jgi:hypothetical protein
VVGGKGLQMVEVKLLHQISWKAEHTILLQTLLSVNQVRPQGNWKQDLLDIMMILVLNMFSLEMSYYVNVDLTPTV